MRSDLLRLSSYHVLSLRILLVEKPEKRYLLPCSAGLESQVPVATPNQMFVIQNLLVSEVLFQNHTLSYPPGRFDCRKNGVSLFTFTFLLILNEIDFSYICGHFYFFLFLTND